MLHALTLTRLEDAVAQPGCPICTIVDHWRRRYLRRLLREDKGHGGVWERHRAVRGLCRDHTRGLIAVEARPMSGFSTAALYQRLIQDLLREAAPGRSPWPLLARRRFRTLLKPAGPCLACEQIAEHQRVEVVGLLDALGSGGRPSLVAAYRRSEGLCLPHLRLALELATDTATFDLLAGQFLGSLDALATGLETFLSSAADDHGAAAPRARPVWFRAVERIAGSLGQSEPCG